ncbi:MAG: glucose-1-phosphate cytidylyltransferase [Salinivirgaceae bacterium]|jgi:glucose-1-phosphate cytidylyltransferase|nr:glucose-1-phosphate cytidylyltransferase [Salinivirgaceae bacterium]
MKVLILAGGLGSRLSEETSLKPKPMVEIGGKPILWHIMKIYASYGYNDFIILCGYKGYVIKEYFANYYRHMADMTIDMNDNTEVYHKSKAEPWKVTLVDTGVNTMTGGRIKRVTDYIGNEPFMVTYGDGLTDVNIKDLVDFHKKHEGIITMTSVQPEGRFGALTIYENNKVESFMEKPRGDGAWINGGFFVCEPEVLDYIEKDATVFEKEPLENLAKEDKLFTFKHRGFWKPMDTLRDKTQMEELIDKGTAPWIKW